jgi:hypothetical protein
MRSASMAQGAGALLYCCIPRGFIVLVRSARGNTESAYVVAVPERETAIAIVKTLCDPGAEFFASPMSEQDIQNIGLSRGDVIRWH